MRRPCASRLGGVFGFRQSGREWNPISKRRRAASGFQHAALGGTGSMRSSFLASGSAGPGPSEVAGKTYPGKAKARQLRPGRDEPEGSPTSASQRAYGSMRPRADSAKAGRKPLPRQPLLWQPELPP